MFLRNCVNQLFVFKLLLILSELIIYQFLDFEYITGSVMGKRYSNEIF